MERGAWEYMALEGTRVRVVMTSGVFDILHRGHLNFLWMSKQQGDILVVGVVSDAGVFEYKNIWPRQSLEERIKSVRQLSFVDFVEEQETTDPTPLIERFGPDVFTHGDDWDRLLRGQETIERRGIEFLLLPYTKGISSTKLREAHL